MNGTKTNVFYWDSCVYLAWILSETTHGRDVSSAIQQIAEDNHNQKNVIISSTITYIEVLAAKIGEDNEALFRKSFRSQDHIAYDVDPPIALKAREIRERFLNDKTGKKIQTPDAIHLATAIIYKADQFMTLDSGLLTLNRDSRIDGLIVCKPLVLQAELGLATTPVLSASPPPPPRRKFAIPELKSTQIPPTERPSRKFDLED